MPNYPYSRRLMSGWILFLACGLGFSTGAPALTIPMAAKSAIVASAAQASGGAPGGFGSYRQPTTPCLTPARRSQIFEAIRTNQRALLASGAIVRAPSTIVRFQWPLMAVGSAAEGFGVHGISNFVDQDPAFPGSTLDYNCGARSYDLASGYNHRGIDYFTWPFPWTWMDNDEVQIVAAAAGTIVLKADGHFDESCGFGTGSWNAVYVEHADGSVAWYGHMKKGSLTPKLVGNTVAAGEYLGVIGSSGSSTAPHLHFEVYDRYSNLVEPYWGPCNTMNTRSWWLRQRPYYDSAINRLMIGDAPVSFPACPGRVTTNEAATIPRGGTGYFTTFYRDQLNTQTTQFRILRPGGSVFTSWSHSSSVSHYAASWWWWSWIIPLGAPTGTWTFEATYEARTYAKTFVVS